MTRPPNPIAQGFRAVTRDPAVFLLEILWRWTFAISAIFLLAITGIVLLGPLHIGPSLSLALNTRDASRLGIILLSIVLQLGSKLIAAAIVLPFVIALIWSLLSASIRRISVRRLRPSAAPVGFRPMLALQFLRSFNTWIGCVLLIAALAGAIRLAVLGSTPNPVLFNQVAAPSVLVIAILWLFFNWYLSLAAIFGVEGQNFRQAFHNARQAVRGQRSDFAGTGFVFLLLRLVLLLIVLAVCGLASGMMATAPEGYSVLVAVTALVYFAVSDFLYVSRMASYLALKSALEEDVIAQLERSAPPAASGRALN
ncbi:MAG TPA: hypothetical protein VKH81_13580 [Candidatus Angelobacter sp.]|nr:hypothetical protein [Candidatus Angelobacter sp.]